MKTTNSQHSPGSTASQLPLATKLFFLANAAAVSMLAFFAMRATEGLFDPIRLKASLHALPQWIQVVLIGVLLVLFAVNFDYVGRTIAGLFARLFHSREVTPRQLAQLRFVILSTILATVAFAMVLVPGAFQAPNRSRLFLIFCAAIAPIFFAAGDWRRSR